MRNRQLPTSKDFAQEDISGTGSAGWDISLETIDIQGSRLIRGRIAKTLTQKKLQRIFPLDGTTAELLHPRSITLKTLAGRRDKLTL